MAETKLWHFLINTFLVVTIRSYRAMKKIGDFTLLALNQLGNLPLLALHTRLLPFVTAFNDAYIAWINTLGTQVGKTLSLHGLLESLSGEDINLWIGMAKPVFPKGSSGFKTLFPKLSKIFQRGSQEDRIAAVAALSNALIGIAGLAELKILVDAKLVLLNNAYNAQKTNITASAMASNLVESCRIALCQELFGILGQLMDIYRVTPASIGAFFDLQAIRNLEQTMWERAVKAMTTVYVFTRTLLPTDMLRLVNNGLSPITFAFVEHKTNPMPLTGTYTVNPLDGQSVPRSDLGNIAFKYMIVKNASGTKIKYMIVII